MTDLSKRRLLHWAGITTLAATAALVGCGKKEEPKPTAAAPAASAAAPKPAPLKAAFVYVGPVGDAGWTFAHDQGRKALEAEFGDKIATTFVEKVPEGADAERVIRDLAAQGNKIIFATSFGFMEPMLKVAAEFPDVKFEHATGYKTAPNMRIYDAKFYEDAYLAGVMAGKMTKSNTLGFVGQLPDSRGAAQHQRLHAGRAERQPQGQDPRGVGQHLVRPAEGERRRAEPDQRRRRRAAAEHRLHRRAADGREERQVRLRLGQRHERGGAQGAPGVVRRRLEPLLQEGRQGRDGRHVEDRTHRVGRQGRRRTSLAKIADFVPEDAKKKVDEVKDGMKAGSFEVFTGPLLDNAGKERLAKGVQADQSWKDKVDFYVKGVEGKIPSGN